MKTDVHTFKVDTCIVVHNITKIPKHIVEQMIDHARNFSDEQKNRTNLVASMSTWHIWQQTDVYNPILQMIEDMAPRVPWINLGSAGEDPEQRIKNPPKLMITDGWVARYDKGDYALEHDHAQSDLSYVYYIKADENCSPIIFENTFEYQPKTGDLVLFPSWMAHTVPLQENDGERLVLAGNLELVPGDVGTNLKLQRLHEEQNRHPNSFVGEESEKITTHPKNTPTEEYNDFDRWEVVDHNQPTSDNTSQQFDDIEVIRVDDDDEPIPKQVHETAQTTQFQSIDMNNMSDEDKQSVKEEVELLQNSFQNDETRARDEEILNKCIASGNYEVLG